MNKVRLIKIYELRSLIHPIEQYIRYITYNKHRFIKIYELRGLIHPIEQYIRYITYNKHRFIPEPQK